jgi:predicted nucleic acid-binding protein
MRSLSPSAALVVDTNIILSTVMGTREGAALPQAGASRMLMVSHETAVEARQVIERIAPTRKDLLRRALSAIEIIDRDKYAVNIEAAGRSLMLAPASRNGSINDRHVLALAWTYGADIWSHDRDFAGTGWPSWSSANLTAALRDEASSSVAGS